MKANNYIIDKLKEAFRIFPETQFRYQFKESSNTHVIEVLPLTFFQENESYLEFEYSFEREFESMFIDEEILFISEESLTSISNADFQIGGSFTTFENECDGCFSFFGDVEFEMYSCLNFALAA